MRFSTIIVACASLSGCDLVDTVAPFLVPNRAPVALGKIPPAFADWRYLPPPDVAVWPYFEDPDRDSLSFTASADHRGALGVTVDGGFVKVSVGAWDYGTVTVTATDPGGLTAEHTFRSGQAGSTPESIPPGYPVPPSPRGRIPSLQVLRGQSATVDLRSHFEAYQATFEAASSSPRGVDVSVSGSKLTVGGVELGSALVNVRARNRGGLATQEFKVVVDPPTARLNSPPAFQGISSRKVIPQGTRFSLEVAQYFSDPEGDALTYTARRGSPVVIWTIRGNQRVPAGAVAVSVTSRSRLVVTGNRPGVSRVTITATDRGGLPVSGDLIVEVTPPVGR